MNSGVRATRMADAQDTTLAALGRITAVLGMDHATLQAQLKRPAKPQNVLDEVLFERGGTARVLVSIADAFEGITPTAPSLDLAVPTATLARFFGAATFDELNGKQLDHAGIAALLERCVDNLRTSIADQSELDPEADDPNAADEDVLDSLLTLAAVQDIPAHELMRLDLDGFTEEELATVGWSVADVVDGEGEDDTDGDDAASDDAEEPATEQPEAAEDAQAEAAQREAAADTTPPKATRTRKAARAEG